MATSKAAEAFDLLKALKSVDEKKIEKIDEELILTANPDTRLTQPWEPGFMDGYKIETTAGHHITMQKIWDAYVAGEQILMVGPSGCGKSSIAFHMLDRANESTRIKNRGILAENIRALKSGTDPKDLKPYHPLPYDISHYSCHEESRSAELIGDVTIIFDEDGNRKPYIVKGAVLEAWTEGRTLILEEMDFGPPGIWGQTHQFFDMRTKETSIFLNGPTRVKKHDRFRVIATANTKGQGENQTEFAGTQVLNRAFLNRFTYVVNVSWLPEDNEVKLIHNKTGLDGNIAHSIVHRVATKSRAAYDAETIETPISTRDLLSWAREIKRAAAKSGISPSDSRFWREIVIPAAYPTFLDRMADDTSKDTIKEYMNLL